MPNDQAGREARSATQSSVMQSYLAMTKPDRRRLQKGGALMVLVAIAYPFVGVLFVSLPPMLWVLDFIVLFVGFLFVWPPAGIWAVERIPSAVMSLVPIGRLARVLGKVPDRRSGGRGSAADRVEADE